VNSSIKTNSFKLNAKILLTDEAIRRKKKPFVSVT